MCRHFVTRLPILGLTGSNPCHFYRFGWWSSNDQVTSQSWIYIPPGKSDAPAVWKFISKREAIIRDIAYVESEKRSDWLIAKNATRAQPNRMPRTGPFSDFYTLFYLCFPAPRLHVQSEAEPAFAEASTFALRATAEKSAGKTHQKAGLKAGLLVCFGAGDRDRTGDVQLGKLTFYRWITPAHYICYKQRI